MTIGLTPYLQFDGNAREAMEFYQSALGGELSVMTFGEGMPPEQVDDSTANLVMHSSLYVERGFHIMASDIPEGMESGGNGTVSLSSDGTDPAEAETLRRSWDALLNGGEATLPLETAPWGDAFGQLRDKFGVNWMVNITAPQD